MAEEIERDARGKALPPRGATLREIATHYFYDVMAAEDESRGCLIDPDPIYGGPLFCCQWRGRPDKCGDCAGVQSRFEDYAIECMTAVLRARELAAAAGAVRDRGDHPA